MIRKDKTDGSTEKADIKSKEKEEEIASCARSPVSFKMPTVQAEERTTQSLSSLWLLRKDESPRG